MISFSGFINSFHLKRHNFKDYFLSLFSPLSVKIYMGVLFVLNLSIWLLVNFIDSLIDAKQIALHYNVDFGIDYYGDIRMLYIIPLLGLLIILINFFVYSVFSRHRDVKFIYHILFSFALITNVLLSIAVISIYLINFR